MDIFITFLLQIFIGIIYNISNDIAFFITVLTHSTNFFSSFLNSVFEGQYLCVSCVNDLVYVLVIDVELFVYCS